MMDAAQWQVLEVEWLPRYNSWSLAQSLLNVMGKQLNLSVSDTLKQCVIMRDCLDVCYDVHVGKVINFSPTCNATLNLIKEQRNDLAT